MIIKELKQQLQVSDHPLAKALHKGDGFKVLVMGFKKGMELKEHQAYVPTKLFVLEGSIIYTEGQNSTTLSQYDETDIPVKAVHAVTALEDSLCLLTQG